MQHWQERLSIDPEVRFGKPCIRGTRIAVRDILGWLASEMTFEEILDDFPTLVREDILAALEFAANREENTKILITAI
nr:DUF433 domain-containing protein [uncultured Dyadobacter sp.]